MEIVILIAAAALITVFIVAKGKSKSSDQPPSTIYPQANPKDIDPEAIKKRPKL